MKLAGFMFGKPSIIGLVTLLLLFGTLGCSQFSSSVASSQAPKENTITVTDSFNRQVQVPKDPKRIGCLYAFTGHVVTMLGKGDEIVAVVEGLQRDELLNQLNPQIQKSAVPTTSGVINIEELLKSKPDLVFISADTARNDGEVNKLNLSHIPYLVVDFNNIEQQQYAIAMIGKAIGAEERAKSYNDFYNAVIKRVQDKVAQIPIKDRVRVFHSVNEATRTDPKESLPSDWLDKAGAISVSADSTLRIVDQVKYFASLEQILVWNPDVIFANEAGVVDYIFGNEQWAAIKAVKNKRVYQMPNGISRWGHPGSLETPMAIIWTAKTLYPDHFKDIDLVTETKNFYKVFFNFQPDDEMTGRILSGVGMRKPRS